ncbi:MAG: helix-turn-helix domain-containing protein [Lyngbya sp.]|nr:helix-turn-helix domain-containing protein [Lyngbya sp.]
MKSRYQYRFYPTNQQRQSLAAVVWMRSCCME